ncbi:MAG: acyl carrier protein [Chloroflexota bacterium]
MNEQEVLAKVKTIIVEQLGADEEEIKLEANFRDDLEADSLDLVELIMAFEEEFGGEISDEEAQTITTVGEAVRYLHASVQSEG